MPMYTASPVRMMCSGWRISPRCSSTVLRKPLSRMMPSSAYTRRRNDVQKGSMITSSSRFCVDLGLRAMA